LNKPPTPFTLRATFEEKTFENYFNAELDRKSKIFFPLGQVQEGYLGFDSSAFTNNRRLWGRLGFPFWFIPPFKGADLRDIAEEMERILGIEISEMPALKANLLFQYKRPDYISISTGSEWPLWKQPYFRYSIYKEQQDLLMQIHNSFQSKLLVLYASPAVQDVNDLVTKKINDEIISSSNFTKASDLDGHSRNTYIRAGTYSIACSEPEHIPRYDLIRELDLIYNNYSRLSDSIENNRDFILQFVNQIRSITLENSYYRDSFNRLNESLSPVLNYELFHSFMTMINFRFLSGLQWIVKL